MFENEIEAISRKFPNMKGLKFKDIKFVISKLNNDLLCDIYLNCILENDDTFEKTSNFIEYLRIELEKREK